MSEETLPTSNVEHEMNNIKGLLAQLKPFETDRVDERVTKARSVLRETIADRSFQIVVAGHNVIPIYYGSLVYNDPVNLDADIKLVSQKVIPDNTSNHIADYLMEELDSQWPTGPGMVDFNTVSLEGLDTIIERVRAEGEPIMDADDADLLAASTILTGQPVLSEQTQELEEMKTKLLGMLHGSEILRRKVSEELNETLAIRKQRRGLVDEAKS